MQSINVQHNRYIYFIRRSQLPTETPFVKRVTKAVPKSHHTIDIAQLPLLEHVSGKSFMLLDIIPF